VQPQPASEGMPAFDELGGLRLRRRVGVSSRRPDGYSPQQLEAIRRAEAYAAEPLCGVVTSDGPVAGLFPLADRGIDTSPLAGAARTFLATLTPQEQAECRFPMDHPSWRHWANPARFYLRHGLCLEGLDEAKRRAAFELIRRSLSDYGFTLVRDIMRLNLTIGELRGEEAELNEWLYWFSIYGEPEVGGAWGWQLDGHHANVNCAIVDDQVVLTPTFLGAEPVCAWSGKYAGTRVFQQEEAQGSKLFGLLSPDQQKAATLGDVLPHDLFTGALRDNFELNYEGIRYDDLTAAQQAVALDLVGLYVGRAVRQQAELTMERVLDHAATLHFAWIRESDRDDVFYYRIHSPVILVEFEHVPGVMFDNDYSTPNHIHTIVRTPNGNDYGVDLLRQHHERYHRVRQPFEWTNRTGVQLTGPFRPAAAPGTRPLGEVG
jgi:hypothetical protein